MDVNFQILIPTLDNKDDIGITLDSIRKQIYPKENIYISIMDFGSCDGTYEHILSFDSYHLGIYKNNETRNRRLMIAELVKVNRFTRDLISSAGKYFFYMVVYPGEILSSNCLEKCAQVIMEHSDLNIDALICETDVREVDGSLTNQCTLFDGDKALSGFRDYELYFSRGYQHQVLCLRKQLGEDNHRLYGHDVNESRWWNKCGAVGGGSTNYYVNEKLAITKRLEYSDELEEILLRFESIIYKGRIYFKDVEKESIERLNEKGRKNLSCYSLWRSYILYKKGKIDEAEKCWRVSVIIDPKCEDSSLYRNVEKLLRDGKKYNGEVIEWLEKYFQNNGMN